MRSTRDFDGLIESVANLQRHSLHNHSIDTITGDLIDTVELSINLRGTQLNVALFIPRANAAVRLAVVI